MIIILLVSVIACQSTGRGDSDIYDEKSIWQTIWYQKKIVTWGKKIDYEKGNSIILVYRKSSHLKSRKGVVHDGGAHQTVYIEILIPYQLEIKTYPIKNKYFKVYGDVIGTPGYYKMYPIDKIRGTVQVMAYEKEKFIKLYLNIQFIEGNKIHPIFKNTAIYKNIPF